MKTIQDTSQDKSAKANRNERLSKDGKWRSFPKVPNLLQYVSTGVYFARLKVSGKLFRRSLETDVFTTAKLKLVDFIKKHSEPVARVGTFGAALKAYLRSIRDSHEISDQTKRYRKFCLRALLKSWPGVRSEQLDHITEADCREWAKRFSSAKDEQYFNNTLSCLRSILEMGGVAQDKNPARKIKRLGVKPTQLQLPSMEQFQQILQEIETAGSRFSQDCAALVRFLAFSGCRISEARTVTWSDVDLKRGEMTVRNAKRSKRSNGELFRKVPIIPELRELLEKLSVKPHSPSDAVCNVGECEKSLTRACRRVEIPKLTHHDLRHLFATRCVESGVDIPTVSRWLGHQDGGALAMRVYGHLRQEHSLLMAQKVSFGGKGAQ